MDYFGFLPSEILARIFGYMDLTEQRPLRRVCRGWNNVLTSSAVLRQVTITIAALGKLKGCMNRTLALEDQGYMACMESVVPYMTKLSIRGFPDSSRMKSRVLRYIDFAIDSPLFSSSLDVAYVDSRVSGNDILKFARETVLSITLVNSRLMTAFPTWNNGLHPVQLRIHGPCRIDISNFDAVKRKEEVVQEWIWKLAEDHVDPSDQHPRFMLSAFDGLSLFTTFSFGQTALRKCGKSTWREVKKIIQLRETAYKDGVGDVLPKLFDFMTLKRLTRLEIGCYLQNAVPSQPNF